MRRIAAMLVLSALALMTVVDAQNCGDRQRRQNGICENCQPNTRAQSWQGQTNAYCQGDVCPDSSANVKSYINIADGTCQMCTGGTVPSQPDQSNGLRTTCISNTQACTGCLQYSLNGVCQTCTGQNVVNSSRNGCNFRQNCIANQYYDSCNQCQNCAAGTIYNDVTKQCQSTTTVTRPTCTCYQQYNSVTNRCDPCQANYLSKNTATYQTGTCQFYSQTCANQNQVQLDQSNCYSCQSCGVGQQYNRLTNSCTTTVVQPQVVRPTCLCYQQYNQITNRCDNCGLSQLSNNSQTYQQGTCQNYVQNCASQGQVQLGQDQCYRCQACNFGTQYQSSTNSCVTPAPQVVRPQCNCYQQYNQATNRCDNCQVNQLSNNSPTLQTGTCQYYNQQCQNQGQIQLGQDQCYQCQQCQFGQTFNRSTNSCTTPVVKPTCTCYQQYNSATNRCDNCPVGQLSDNSQTYQTGTCRTYTNSCQSNQVRLGQDQCYRCQSCSQGQTVVNGVCTTPRPTCNCYQQYNQSTNRCDNCPVGQLSNNSQTFQQGTCQTYTNTCSSNQIRLGQDQCYRCQSCQSGQVVVNGVCTTPRPTCTCYQRYNASTNRCENCPAGSLANANNFGNTGASTTCQQVPQQCNQNNQIQLGQTQCYQCQACPAGNTIVNNQCQVPRPVCSCFQEYNQATNQCVNCQANQLSGNGQGQQNLRCRVFAQTCNSRGQLQLGQNQCFQCQACPAGNTIVNNVCTLPRPTCNCYQEYNQSTNNCDNCGVGQYSGNGQGGQQNLRCRLATQNCNQQGQIQLGQQQCFACQRCQTGYQLVGNQCQRPRPTCNCYQQYNSATNLCDNCPAGQLSGNNVNNLGGINQQDGRCSTYGQNCNASGQVQLGQQQCYGCQACTGVNQIIVGNRCVARVTCQCYQQYNSATNTCTNCPAGSLANANTGQCERMTMGCNQNGRVQLTQQQCYQCRDCPVGQILGTNNVCVTPRPTCRCHEIVNTSNQCQACPANQLADATNSRCVTRPNTCTGNQVVSDQLNCYTCIACLETQQPDATRTYCVNRPLANCGCLSRRSGLGFTCENCPVGQIADPNNPNQCLVQPACDQFSIRLARDATTCGRCQRCNWPSQIPDPITGTRCVIRPRPSCTCTQRYGDEGYSCIECPFGQVRSGIVSAGNVNSNTINAQCVNPPTCNATNQIRLAVDSTSCGRCQTCQFPRFIPDVSRTQCVARPFASCPDCTQRQSDDGYSCVACPAGSIQDPTNTKRCNRPTCSGQYQIQLSFNNLQCGACETCQWPAYMPNAGRTQCVQRPLATCPTCTQRQSDDGYSCVACPAGQIQDANNARVCYTPVCNGMYEIQLPVNQRSCGKCQACQWPRQMPNNERTACVNRPFAQCPDCLSRRSDDNYTCEQCPFGQVKDPQNQNRCVTRTCNGARQIQLAVDNTSCGRCETCQWPQFTPDQTKTQCVARPMAVCDCRQRQSQDGYSCETCPAGQVQSLTNQKQCVRPNCSGQYEIQLSIDTNNCGRCETCQWPQFAPNSSRTQCVARPLANCNCLSRRSGLGYTCERCQPGTVQNPNNVNECITPYCGGSYQITKPLDQNNCGKCEDCQYPRYIPNNERTQCVLRPLAQCDCLSRQSQDRYSCEACDYNQIQDPRNPQRCIDAPRCNQGNQILGLRDTQNCMRCRTCIAPQIPRTDRSECYRPRPTCSCTERYSADGYSCLPCPNGQVSDEARQACYPAPQCFGPREILGTRQNCYRCNQCPSNLVPNDTRTQCVRPIPVCSCTQRYSPDGYECLECPNRQVVDPNNNKRCVPQICNQRNNIFSTREYCYRCDVCPQGYEPNPQRTECLRIKPKCSCTEIYDSSGYVCVPCPPWQVAANNNQRCVPRQCSGINEVLGDASTCYACKECQKGSTPDNLRRRCLRYITTACTCNQRFDQSGFGCVDCPAGTRPSLDNRSCVSLNCDPDQILRRDLLCPQCEWCPPGSIPDPKRENCIVKPRPAINVNGVPTCDEFSVFNMDRTECIKCPNNLKASADNLRCLNSCTDPLDIVQEDGSCFTCCNGNVPNYSRTRCVKKKTQTDTCTGDREIYNSDRTRCSTCDPYTRAQRSNTVCLSDQCSANQIITWLGTCAECLAGENKVDQYTCTGGSGTRLNAQLVEEPVEELSSVAKKEKSFPTVVVAGLGILIMVLSAVTGMICLRGRDKAAVQEEQVVEKSPAQNDAQTFEHLTQVMEKAPTDDSGSNGKNSE